MSGPIFVFDSEERPLMPTAAARARQLMQQGKASRKPHHVFTLVQLAQPVPQPSLRPVVLGVAIHQHTAELFLLAEGVCEMFPLLYSIVDLQTDLPRRIRRRAMHRRRRRQRGRYRAPRRYGRPFKRRRAWSTRSTRRQVAVPQRSAQRHRHRTHNSPTMRWRAHAIERVIKALQKLVPISHIVLLDTASPPHVSFASLTSAERRQRLIETYGIPDEDGRRRAQCAYCGTTEGAIEAEHIIPKSRGGTDAQWNLTLACDTCNRRKGDSTPTEAGMVPRFPDQAAPGYSQRAAPYIRFTARLLVERLQHEQIPVIEQGRLSDTLPEPLATALTTFAAAPGDTMTVVAKPISRPRKQIFTARNYPFSTPRRSGLERVGQTIKRRNRVNLGLVLQRQGQRTTVAVLKAGTPPSANAAHQVIRLGMLCSGERLGKTVTGIVQAIHSTGKLSLITPTHASPDGVSWQRMVISPRQNLHILSTERVIFLKVSTPTDSPTHAQTPEDTDE